MEVRAVEGGRKVGRAREMERQREQQKLKERVEG